MMTATIKEFLFRAAMMVHTSIFFAMMVQLHTCIFAMMMHTWLSLVSSYLPCFKIVEGPYNLQVGKEDEDGEGDGRVGFL